MAQTRFIRFFPLGASFALLVLLVVACGDEATLSPTSTPELIPTQAPSEELEGAKPPYPPSPVIEDITWHMDTHITAAPGSDIWPIT
jgi:hypothetical protein